MKIQDIEQWVFSNAYRNDMPNRDVQINFSPDTGRWVVFTTNNLHFDDEKCGVGDTLLNALNEIDRRTNSVTPQQLNGD